jgi:hypothetical protein
MTTSGNQCHFSIRFKNVLENKELFNVILGYTPNKKKNDNGVEININAIDKMDDLPGFVQSRKGYSIFPLAKK